MRREAKRIWEEEKGNMLGENGSGGVANPLLFRGIVMINWLVDL